MNEKELSEIRRRFRADKSNITRIRGCYVSEGREILSQFDQSLGLLTEEEREKFLAILKRAVSGVPGKNLWDITFDTQQVVDSEEHKLLMALRGSALQEEAAVQRFFNTVLESQPLEGSYLILLTYDSYDVPFRSKDDVRQNDAGGEVYHYILCSICPVKLSKPGLGYRVQENEFHNCHQDFFVSAPELGFLFPAFDDRSANLYAALCYTRDASKAHEGFVDAIFRQEPPLPAALQKESFDALLGECLQEDGSLEVVQAVHEQLRELIAEHKADKELPPLRLNKKEYGDILRASGVSEGDTERFSESYEEAFGADTEISPCNLVDKRIELKTPDVDIRVNPERPDLVQTRVIDGVKYLLIRADEGVCLGGVNIQIFD